MLQLLTHSQRGRALESLASNEAKRTGNPQISQIDADLGAIGNLKSVQILKICGLDIIL
jgi:hypothetical protein